MTTITSKLMGLRRKGKHRKRGDKISTKSIEAFLSKQTGLRFISGITKENGAVVYKTYREKPTDPERHTSPTPDLVVLYFTNKWNIALIEFKASQSRYTSGNLEDQRTRTIDEIRNPDSFKRFMDSLNDKHLTGKIRNQILESGIEYYCAKVTPQGNLSPLQRSSELYTF